MTIATVTMIPVNSLLMARYPFLELQVDLAAFRLALQDIVPDLVAHLDDRFDR